MRDFVTDLYGGNGVQLARRPRNEEFSAFDPSFSFASLGSLESLGSEITSSLVFLTPTPAVAHFEFDLERGVPVRTTDSFGPLIAQRAETIGQRRLEIGFSYSRQDFKRLNGESLRDITLFVPSRDQNGDGLLGPPPDVLDFELDEVRLDLDLAIKQEAYAFLATYGLTSRWDVGLIVPVIHLRAQANSRATIQRNTADPARSRIFHNFGPGSDCPDGPTDGPCLSHVSRSATGFGDLLLRTKYNVLLERGNWPDFSVAGQVRLPTGRKEDLLGTGASHFLLLLIASRQISWFAPHANLGYELSTGPSELDALRYIAGFDVRAHSRLTLALDVVGRWLPNETQFANHTSDVAVGFRLNILRTLLVDANFTMPLNGNSGLRPDFIWSIGLEYTFGGWSGR